MAKRTAPKIYVTRLTRDRVWGYKIPESISQRKVITGIFYDYDLACAKCAEDDYIEVFEVVLNSVPMKFKKARR